MKRLLTILALAAIVALGASAKGSYSHDASVLPEAARTTIANNCKAKVSVVKIDKDFGRISEYEVILNDGTEISFDTKGNWKNVETNKEKSVPSAFVPEGVRKYVAANHKGQRVVGIEKEHKGYDVELSNGIDMKFSLDGQFLRYDD